MWHGIAIFLGVTNPSGRAYLFWSGVGADLGYLAFPVVVFEYARRNTCDVPRCHRIARRKVKDKYGDTQSVCRRHAPSTEEQEKRLAQRLAEHDERPLHP